MCIHFNRLLVFPTILQVGPKKKNLVVNDKSKQAFKPKELVREICSVYINLSDNQAFLKVGGGKVRCW